MDGSQHADDEEKDLESKQWLNQKGFRVIRFWNNEVMFNCTGVLEENLEHCKKTPSLNPSLEGGRWIWERVETPRWQVWFIMGTIGTSFKVCLSMTDVKM